MAAIIAATSRFPATPRGRRLGGIESASSTIEWTPIHSGADDPVETDTSPGRVCHAQSADIRHRRAARPMRCRRGIRGSWLAEDPGGHHRDRAEPGRDGRALPGAAAVYSTFVELLCGAALILGVALPGRGDAAVPRHGRRVRLHPRQARNLPRRQRERCTTGSSWSSSSAWPRSCSRPAAGGRLTLDHRLFGRARRA